MLLELEPRNKYTKALNWLVVVAIFTALLDAVSTYIALRYFSNCMDEANPVAGIKMATYGISYILVLMLTRSATIMLIRLSRFSSIVRIITLGFTGFASLFAGVNNTVRIIIAHTTGC